MSNTISETAAVVSSSKTKESVIVYFDGVCGFCNEGVNFLMSHDPAGKFTYAPLQGETAKKALSPEEIARLDTLVVTINGKSYRKSAAIVRILRKLGGAWSLLGNLLWVIPRPLRDLGYTFVARNRYRLFGKQEACRMPTPNERDRILP